MVINKRGISPLIATVLIIGFTIVIAALVITFGTNLIRGQISDTEKSAALTTLCRSIDLEVTGRIPLTSSTTLDISVTNNNDKAIEGVVIVISDPTGVANTLSTQQLIIPNDPSTALISPAVPTKIGSFVSKKFTITPSPATPPLRYNNVIVRGLVKDFNGDVKSCPAPFEGSIVAP